MWTRLVHRLIDGVDSWRGTIVRISDMFAEALTVLRMVSSSFIRGSFSSRGLLSVWWGKYTIQATTLAHPDPLD